MNWIAAAGIGLVAGVIASGAMAAYQAATASAFGQDQGNDDPATVKAADDASKAATGEAVTQKRRRTAGTLVHYATGTALGVLYAVAVFFWPPATALFGAGFGIATALVLDDLLVPAFGWGPWPWATPLGTHLYSLTSHIVFGLVLEAVRRLVLAVIG